MNYVITLFKSIILVFFYGILSSCTNTADSPHTSNDRILIEIIKNNDIRPLIPKPFEETNKYFLGQALFFDPILSGNRDVSCATCHLLKRGTSDALPLSIGINGDGLGEKRTLITGEIEHPRNSIDLWNRDSNTVRTLFWDGRVEALDPILRTFRSPMEDLLYPNMQNTLAIQALFPLVRHDEMLGNPGDISSNNLPNGHKSQPNELAVNDKTLTEPERIRKVHSLIIQRLLGGNSDNLTNWQIEYRRLFKTAFPAKELDKMSIVEVGNSIAHYEEVAFATRNTPWDNYLKGSTQAITEDAKKGAIVFFGKGKCSHCHNDELFSDFKFHSLALEQTGPGVDMTGDDLGRFEATKDPQDKYKFRTPPLRNVTYTTPYLHDGSSKTIEDAINRHFDHAHITENSANNEARLQKQRLDSLSPILKNSPFLNSMDIKYLNAFLKSLEDKESFNANHVIPNSVPSGLPVSTLIDE